MKSVIIDTSSMLFGASNRIDVAQRLFESFPEHLLIVPSGVMRELIRISKGRRKESMQAKVALALLKSHAIKVVRTGGYVDDWILSHSGGEGTIVCTNDAGLKRKLRQRGVRTVSVTVSGSVR